MILVTSLIPWGLPTVQYANDGSRGGASGPQNQLRRALPHRSEKVKAIQEDPKPRSFLGLLSHYSKFLPNMSIMLAPLYSLAVAKEPKVVEQQQAFESAKAFLHQMHF